MAAVDSQGRTILVADAHRDDGKRFIVRADEKLTAFLELESAIRLVKSDRTAAREREGRLKIGGLSFGFSAHQANEKPFEKERGDENSHGSNEESSKRDAYVEQESDDCTNALFREQLTLD